MSKKQKKSPKKPIPKTSLMDRLFPPASKPKSPTCYQMAVMEENLKKINLPKPLYKYTDKELLSLFHIKLELVENKDIANSAFTVLKPSADSKLNAVLMVRKGDVTMVNSLIYDVAAFLLNMAEDGKIKEEIVRNKKEKDSVYTLKRDCLARMILLPREDLECAIACYDKSKPKMDELKFVADLSKKYRVHSQMVIKRIRDIRRIKTTSAYADYLYANARLDFLCESERIKELPFINKKTKK